METLVPPLINYLELLAVALVLMTAVWSLSLVIKDASIVDRFWGLGFCALYGFQSFESGFLTFRAVLVLLLVLLWGLRLSIYIHLRNSNKPEDARYREMRRQAGVRFWWTSLFTVFLLQGFILWLVSAPLISVLLFSQTTEAGVWDWAGLFVWSGGLIFETVADYQMASFKRNPKNRGQVCRSGLWNLSRHPNYFGEACLWWGFWLISLNTTSGFYTVFSPLLMTFLLLRVSGVSLLEKQLAVSKPGYAEYIESVPAFFPFGPVR